MPSQLTSWWHQCPLPKGLDLWSLARPQSLQRAVWSGVIWSHCSVCRDVHTHSFVHAAALPMVRWHHKQKPQPSKAQLPGLFSSPTCTKRHYPPVQKTTLCTHSFSSLGMVITWPYKRETIPLAAICELTAPLVSKEVRVDGFEWEQWKDDKAAFHRKSSKVTVKKGR